MKAATNLLAAALMVVSLAILLAAALAVILVITGCSPGTEVPGATEIPGAAKIAGATEVPGAAEPEENRPTPAPAVETGREPTPTPVPPTPKTICNLAKPVQKAVLRELGKASCQEATMGDLGSIKKLLITGAPITGGIMQKMPDLARLEIKDLETPLGANALAGLKELRTLTISAQRPRSGTPGISSILSPGIFRDLGRLEKLTVTGDDGWNEQDITKEWMSGMPQLRHLKLNYVRSIEPDALDQATLLEEVRIHGTSRWRQFPPRIPRRLFAHLPNLKQVEIRNFRWPPVVDVPNHEVACQAKSWLSFNSPEDPGRTPLSALVEGKYSQPKDVESLKDCGQEER